MSAPSVELHHGHPVQQLDRRLHARSRPGHLTRRSYDRYYCDFPVTLFVGAGEQAREYHGTARDISDGGVLLENLDLPADESRVRLRFRLPSETLPEEFGRGAYEFEGKVQHREGTVAGVQFEQPMTIRLASTVWQRLRYLAMSVFLLAISLILLIKIENVYYFWYDVPLFLYSLAVGVYLVSRFAFAALYRTPKTQTGPPPTMTLVVSVFNEEENIRRTLTQALESDYPRDRLQIIAVDDGSSDQSLAIMNEVRQRYPELIVVHLERNCGKRKALAAGVQLATGELLTVLDSDSFLAPDALSRIAEGFADPKVMAVSGHCEVENMWTNLLTRMQAVRYFISFRVMKAAESVFDFVSCLSGPLSCYRRAAFEACMDEWLGQEFFGTPATYGDDRAMTNLLLRKGAHVIYDYRAKTTTAVPDTFRSFMTQQLRWKRSWFRESFRACGFMWKQQPFGSFSYYLGFILPLLGPAVVFRALLYVPLFQQGSPLAYLGGILLMSGLMSATYLLIKRSPLWFYGVPFCFFYMLIIVWQLPWAVATCYRPDWGTRHTSEAS